LGAVGLVALAVAAGLVAALSGWIFPGDLVTVVTWDCKDPKTPQPFCKENGWISKFQVQTDKEGKSVFLIIPQGIFRHDNCTVIDRLNWQCEINTSDVLTSYKMIDGKYAFRQSFRPFESSISEFGSSSLWFRLRYLVGLAP
jgi:hypothetical protein